MIPKDFSGDAKRTSDSTLICISKTGVTLRAYCVESVRSSLATSLVASMVQTVNGKAMITGVRYDITVEQFLQDR